MHITVEIPDDVGQAVQDLPDLNEFATEAFRAALSRNSPQRRPLTDLETQFLLEARERAKQGDLLTHEESEEFFRSKGVNVDEI